MEQLYYRVAEVTALFNVSHDTLNRLVRYGVLEAIGHRRQRRYLGASVAHLVARIHAGESVWEILRAAEEAVNANAEAPGASPMDAEASSSTPHDNNGVTLRRALRARGRKRSSSATTPIQSGGPDWLKKIG